MFLPDAIAIGVDYDTFWTLNPRKLKFIIKGFEKREEFEAKKADRVAWLQGVYFASAIGSVLNGKKYYPKQPFSMKEEDVDRDEDKPHPYALMFGAWAIEHNLKFKKKER